MDWLRLWHDMPTDPKFRVVARRSGQPVTSVISVYIYMLVNASANATERGRTRNWCNEDVAESLCMEEAQVVAILTAMEGKLIEKGALTGWDKRQPKREDNSASRAKEWRERQKEKGLENATERTVTQQNAQIREDTDKNIIKNKPKGLQKGSRLTNDENMELPDEYGEWAIEEYRITANEACDIWDRFRDYWISQPGSKGVKANWSTTWKNWVRRAMEEKR